MERLPHVWLVAARSAELRQEPLAVTLQETPLVLWRDRSGVAAALLDRCPHRNAPLSDGKVLGSELECPYHGWRFDPGGRCAAVPGLSGDPDRPARQVENYAVMERDRFIWVYSEPNIDPKTEPPSLPELEGRHRFEWRISGTTSGSLYATLENILDVPHTAFVHDGLFRSSRKPRTEIEVRVRRLGGAGSSETGVEAEFIDEPPPSGLAGWLLAPGGGTVIHRDRFLLPTTAQVEYRWSTSAALIATHFVTPHEEGRTTLHLVLRARSALPGWIARPLLAPFLRRILRQDAAVLARQAETVRRFGGERFASTEIDLFGQEIRRLLNRSMRGEEGALEPLERVIRLRV